MVKAVLLTFFQVVGITPGAITWWLGYWITNLEVPNSKPFVGIPILTSVYRFCAHQFGAPRLRKTNQPNKKSVKSGLNSFTELALPSKTSTER